MAAARQTCRHDFGLTAALLVALLPTWELRASAEEATRIVRVGVLASAEQRPIQSFTERLRELGWIVGKKRPVRLSLGGSERHSLGRAGGRTGCDSDTPNRQIDLAMDSVERLAAVAGLKLDGEDRFRERPWPRF
jgi:hypothetical protein